MYGRVDFITPVNRFGYAPRTTFLDPGGGLIGGGISLNRSFAFQPGDFVEIKFDASGNQLRPNTADYFTITLDITEQGGEAEEYGYQKLEILEAAFGRDGSPSAAARRFEVTTGLLYTWRRLHRAGELLGRAISSGP